MSEAQAFFTVKAGVLASLFIARNNLALEVLGPAFVANAVLIIDQRESVQLGTKDVICFLGLLVRFKGAPRPVEKSVLLRDHLALALVNFGKKLSFGFIDFGNHY